MTLGTKGLKIVLVEAIYVTEFSFQHILCLGRRAHQQGSMVRLSTVVAAVGISVVIGGIQTWFRIPYLPLTSWVTFGKLPAS